MTLEEVLIDCSREIGTAEDVIKDARIYAQSLSRAGTAQLELTPEEEVYVRKRFRAILANPIARAALADRHKRTQAAN